MENQEILMSPEEIQALQEASVAREEARLLMDKNDFITHFNKKRVAGIMKRLGELDSLFERNESFYKDDVNYLSKKESIINERLELVAKLKVQYMPAIKQGA